MSVRTFIFKGQKRVKLTLKTKNALPLLSEKSTKVQVRLDPGVPQDSPSPPLGSSFSVLALFMAGMWGCYPYCGLQWLQAHIPPPVQPQWKKTLSMPKFAGKV